MQLFDFFSSSLNNLQTVLNNLTNSMNQVNTQSQGTISSLFSNQTIYDVVKAITQNAVVPFGILLLIVFLAMDLTGKLTDINLRSDNGLSHIMSFLIKLVLGVLLISNSFLLVDGVFTVANVMVNDSNKYIIEKESQMSEEIKILKEDVNIYDIMAKKLEDNGIDTNYSPNFFQSLSDWFTKGSIDRGEVMLYMNENNVSYKEAREVFQKEIEEKLLSKNEDRRNAYISKLYQENFTVGNEFAFWLVTFIMMIISYAIPIITLIVLMSRAIELYLYVTISPVTLSLIFNRNTIHSGINFIKNVFSFGIQAFVILFIIFIYKLLLSTSINDLLTGVNTNTDLVSLSLELLGYGILASMMLLQSKSLSQKLLGS